MELTVPPAVAAKARVAGSGGWLTGLPGLVAELSREWGVTVGRAFPDATEAFVAEAVTADGTPAVLKLLVPRAGGHAGHEIAVLRLTAGSGCATLLRHDEARHALLLERLGPSLADLGLPLERRLEILCDAAARVWRPVPAPVALPTGAAKAEWLIGFIERRWADLGRPCAAATVRHAVRAAERRIAAHGDDRSVLVHGDVHQWNALRAGDGFKLVDPDGLRAEPEYDLGVLMREDPVELVAGDPRDRARWLARRTGLDATAIWEWGVVERVSTGLVLAAIDVQPLARQMLGAADAISRDATSGP
ncbi:aminoglycoside phosphotransferase family protein [Jidongwangia harbinensis]|uniref:aminoglycoside phosphotransferase family protein n=1 Tax=Jidongwangia harbinensis TaxID=2878561 RepID=UPI001CD993DD|nr:aminoglycoside phosphotransferase family protein [Jidongwangia harbinensis]MCA2212176.1 aminoglycoside phosphotransferase family protein [Jidongwangia harbinensis]